MQQLQQEQERGDILAAQVDQMRQDLNLQRDAAAAREQGERESNMMHYWAKVTLAVGPGRAEPARVLAAWMLQTVGIMWEGWAGWT